LPSYRFIFAFLFLIVFLLSLFAKHTVDPRLQNLRPTQKKVHRIASTKTLPNGVAEAAKQAVLPNYPVLAAKPVANIMASYQLSGITIWREEVELFQR
jgi:hypothetical protein